MIMEKHGCGFDCLVDGGTGSGQALTYWTEVFHNCAGVDISGEQIDKATKSFFLTTWHWLDAEKFYKETTRVLRQPGVLAVYSYGLLFFPSSQKAIDVIIAFYIETLSKVWHPDVRRIMNQYNEVELPHSVTERHDITQKWPIPLS